MLDIKTFTNIGDRDNNEDYFGYVHQNNLYCFVVCDGLGGHEYGQVAAKFVTDSLLLAFKNKPVCNESEIGKYIQDTQDKLLIYQKKYPAYSEMKTTVAMVITDGEKVIMGHVGDSRIYIFSRGKVVEHSKDHSVPGVLVATGEIKPEDIRSHEDRNKLLRVMGMEWTSPKYDIKTYRHLNKGDALLLCTDGFWENLYEKEMISSLKRAKNTEKWIERMVKIIRKNKNISDNYTAIGIIR